MYVYKWTYLWSIGLQLWRPCTIRAPVFGRNHNLAPQSITEQPMEVDYLDEWFVIIQCMLQTYYSESTVQLQVQVQGHIVTPKIQKGPCKTWTMVLVM